MANFDINVVVTVTTEAPPAGIASFTVPIFVGSPDFAGGLIRYYESASEVAADTDLGEPAETAATEGFSQSPGVASLGVARIPPTTPQVVEWTVATNPTAGDEFELRYNGIQCQYTAVALDTASDVADGLRTAAGLALAAEPVTVGGAGATASFTADTAEDTFSYGHWTDSATTTMSISSLTSQFTAALIDDGLDAIRAEDDDWYAFTLQSQDKDDIEAAAAWAEANQKLFIGQTWDPDSKTGGPGDPIAALEALGYLQSAVLWRHQSYADQWSAFQWMCKTLAADPDDQTTIWAYKRLTGSTSDEDKLTATEKNEILDNYGSVYLPFKSTPVTGMGRTASGHPLDLVLTLNWVEARVQEAIVAELINYSNRNEKIRYTDIGISVIQQIIQGVLATGVEVGHFTQTEDSPSVTVPLLADVSAADKNARLLRCSFEAIAAGAIEFVTITGSVLVSV
jgi:hypothetical protein